MWGYSAPRMSPGPALPALLLYFAAQSTPTLPSRENRCLTPIFSDSSSALKRRARRSEIKEERQRQLPRGTFAESGMAGQRTVPNEKKSVSDPNFLTPISLSQTQGTKPTACI